MTISEANEPAANGVRIIIALKGLKNIHVAKRSGFSQQELSDMLNGRRLIKACDIPKLAKGLGVKESDIYKAGKKGE